MPTHEVVMENHRRHKQKEAVEKAQFKQYTVELHGEVREVYTVNAKSEEDARANWTKGHLFISEASGMEVTSVELDD